MTSRALRYFLLLPAVLIGTAAVLAVWLLYTTSGAAWLWARAESALAGRLQAAAVDGSLRGGLELRGVVYRDEVVDARIERVRFVLDPDLFSPAVNIDDLDASELTVALVADRVDDEDDGQGMRPGEILAALELPLPLRVRNLAVDKLDVVAADGASLFAAEALYLTASLHDTLRILKLEVVATGGRASLSAALALAPPHELDVAADIDVTGGALRIPAPLPRAGRVSLQGTLAKFAVTIDGRAPEVSIVGEVSDIERRMSFDLTATAATLPLAGGADAQVSLHDATLALKGSPNDYRAELRGRIETAAVAPLAADAAFTGDLRGLSVQRLTLTSTEIDAALVGSLGWAGGLSAAADIELARFDPTRWLTVWPAGETLSGRAALGLDGARLAVDAVELAHRDAELRGRGVVDLDGGVVDVDVSWDAMQWPLAPTVPRIKSPSATLALTGSPSDWRLVGDIVLAAADLPQGSFKLEGSGTPRRFDFSILDSQVLGGRVTGRVSAELEQTLRWSAQLDTANLQVAPLLPQWPGRISASIDAAGQAEPFELSVDVGDLSGELRARPVSAAGRLLLSGDIVRFDDLRLASGDSSLTLDGALYSPEGVRFAVDIVTLADLLPDSAGRVKGSGRVAAGSPWPFVDAELLASDLGWRDWSAGSVAIANHPESAERPFAMTLNAADLHFGPRQLASAGITLAGAPEQHELALTLGASAGDVEATLTGTLENPGLPAAASWDGELGKLALRLADDTRFTLREPAALFLGRGDVRLARGCVADGGDGVLCAAGHWSSDASYNARFELESFPLDLLRIASGADLEFTQRLDGAVSLATGPRGRPSGQGRIDITPGVLRNPFDDRLTLKTRAGFVAFELEQGRLLFAEISLPFSDAAEIAGTFRVLDVASGTDSPIAGQLTANVRDIGVGASIVPRIDEAAGRLDADFTVGGTLGEPLFGGGLTLRDGRLAYDPLGLRVEEIQLESKILPGNRVELDGSFRAGSGSGRLKSSADYLQGLSGGFEVAVTGSDLTLIDLPDLRVTIDPDLEIGVRGDNIRLGGRVRVPSARLASVKFVNTGVSESEDVVFVGDEQPADSELPVETSPLDWRGSVELELGDDVVIDVDVAQARLSGTTTYTWQGPALPQASGAFAVTGRFQAYGQLLEITEGTIRYPNAPANNPLLRIRAEREIFGNSQVRRAGVLVTGSALRPELEVYTTPATSQNRALTLLVTGSDFNFEQGVGAVDVGTYVAPDLYVGYGIGLFDRENVISVRYDLARGFGIKATSGRRAAGVDISYTIQR